MKTTKSLGKRAFSDSLLDLLINGLGSCAAQMLRTNPKKMAKAERQKKYKWIFMNGKQVRVKRLPLIDGMDADEFIRQNADPIWLHQNEMWEYIQTEDEDEDDQF